MKGTSRKSSIDGKGEALCSQAGIPHFECLVIESRDDPPPIGTDRTAVDPVRMASESEPLDSDGGIPYLECAVSGGGDDKVAIGTHKERDTFSSWQIQRWAVSSCRRY